MSSSTSLTTKGLEQARDCLSLLKYSEDVIRRDIELARQQVELRLKKLEVRVLEELNDVVETENFKVDEIIANLQDLEKDVQIKGIDDELTREAILLNIQNLEKVRIRFDVNPNIEKYIDTLESIGTLNTVRVRVTVDDPNAAGLENENDEGIEGERLAPEGETSDNDKENGNIRKAYANEKEDYTEEDPDNSIGDTNEETKDPMTVLRNIKTSIQNLGIKKQGNAEGSSDKPKSSLEAFNFSILRCNTNIKSFKPTDFGDITIHEIDSDTTGDMNFERGRSRNKRSDLARESDEMDLDYNNYNVSQYGYENFTTRPRRHVDKVRLANEMWFGKYSSAFDRKDYRRARSLSPETIKSRSNSDKGGSDSTDTSDDAFDKSGKGSESGAQGSTKRSSLKKSRMSLKDKKKRRVTIAVDITSDIKEAREKENNYQEINQHHTESENVIGAETDERMEVTGDLQHPTSENIKQHEDTENGAPGESFEDREPSSEINATSVEVKQKDKRDDETKPSDNSIPGLGDTQMDVDNTIKSDQVSPTANKRVPSSRDKRKRNKTITGNISADLQAARNMMGDDNKDNVNDNNDMEASDITNIEQSNRDDGNTNTPVGNSFTIMDKRRRNKTISVDVSEVLKQARDNFKNGDNDANATEGGVIHVSEWKGHLVLDRSSGSPVRYPQLQFNRSSFTKGKASDKITEPLGENSGQKRRGEKRTHLEIASKFRIPSFDEMLYNK